MKQGTPVGRPAREVPIPLAWTAPADKSQVANLQRRFLHLWKNADSPHLRCDEPWTVTQPISNWRLQPFSERNTRNSPCFPKVHWMAPEPCTQSIVVFAIGNIQVRLWWYQPIILISLCLFAVSFCNLLQCCGSLCNLAHSLMPYCLFILFSFRFAVCCCLVFAFADRAFRHYFSFHW